MSRGQAISIDQIYTSEFQQREANIKTIKKKKFQKKSKEIFDISKATCYKYEKKGHFARECQTPEQASKRKQKLYVKKTSAQKSFWEELTNDSNSDFRVQMHKT